MDNKVLFNFGIREKTKPGPKKIVVAKEEVQTIKTSRRVLENKIVITPYEVDYNYNHVPNYDYEEVNDDYCFINARLLEPIFPNLTKTALKLIWHAIYILQPNSNIVNFPMYSITQIHGSVKAGMVYKELDKLEELGLMTRTNRRSYYIINHNLFFKGNLKEFAEKYKELYGDRKCEFDDKGYVIIDNDFSAELIQSKNNLIKVE